MKVTQKLELDINDLTTGELAGTGLFEELMRSTHGQLLNEYNGGRITGTEYAQAYTVSMGHVLQNSVQYLLQYLTVNKNLELMQKQIEAAEKNNELIELQKEQLRLANETAKFNLDCILPEQCKQAKLTTTIMMEQVIQTEIQTDILRSQLTAAELQVQLVTEQIKNEADKNTDPTGGLNYVQFEKVKAEMEVMKQKIITEKAQTTSTIDGVKVGGLVGMETMLRENQAQSFLRNAEVQAAKVYADVYGIAYTTDPIGLEPNEFGFSRENISKVMEKLSTGILAGWDAESIRPEIKPEG